MVQMVVQMVQIGANSAHGANSGANGAKWCTWFKLRKLLKICAITAHGGAKGASWCKEGPQDFWSPPGTGGGRGTASQYYDCTTSPHNAPNPNCGLASKSSSPLASLHIFHIRSIFHLLHL